MRVPEWEIGRWTGPLTYIITSRVFRDARASARDPIYLYSGAIGMRAHVLARAAACACAEPRGSVIPGVIAGRASKLIPGRRNSAGRSSFKPRTLN